MSTKFRGKMLKTILGMVEKNSENYDEILGSLKKFVLIFLGNFRKYFKNF